MLLDIQEPGKEEGQKDNREYIVGIDFGTTNSLVSYCDESGCVTIPVNGREILPSKVFIENVEIPSIKRAFGKSLDDVLEGNFLSDFIKNKCTKDEDGNLVLSINSKNYMPIEIGAEIFKALKKGAEEYISSKMKSNHHGNSDEKIKIQKAVISVPAYFDDATRSMVRDSARLAGIEVVRLIAEPTAAAYSYGLENSKEGNYLVYDLGGGTFDVSILKMRMGAFQVISTGGDNELGGDDIDSAIANYLKSNYNIDQEKINTQELQEISSALKKELTNSEIADHNFDGIVIELSREELSEISKNLVDKTIRITKKTLFDSKLDKIDGIILVGGATKSPAIRQRIKSEFPDIDIIDGVNPDKVVSVGAAKQAWNLSSNQGDVLVDVLPLSLGLELYGGVVEKVIHRNTPIPSSVKKKFTTYADYQTGLDLHILQGDREMASDCRSIARFQLKNLPAKPAGKVEVEVAFNIDTDGLLKVSAKELSTDKFQEIEVRPTYGLTDEKIYSMLKKAMDMAEEDLEKSKVINLNVEIESSISKLQKLIKDNEDLLSKNEKANLLALCEELSNNNKYLNSQQLEEKLEKLEMESNFFVTRIMDKGLAYYAKGKKIEQIIST